MEPAVTSAREVAPIDAVIWLTYVVSITGHSSVSNNDVLFISGRHSWQPALLSGRARNSWRCALCNRYCFLVVAVLVLSGCGAKPHVTPLNPPAAAVTISVNPSSVEPGQQATLTWTVAFATSCTASGDWSGSPLKSGSQNVILPDSKGLTYTLACTGAGGSATQTAKLSAAEGPGGCTVNPLVRSGVGRRSIRHRASSQRVLGK